MRKGLSGLLIMMFLLLCLGSGFADPSAILQDSSLRPGPWQEAYARILEERSTDIQAYEEYVVSVTYSPECRPAGLTDLTGDGVPELIFLDLVTDTEYGFNVGRLWIYTSDRSGVHCAMSLQPEIDDLLYSTFYLGKNGILTLYFNDTEMSWTMRFRFNPDGHYATETVLIEQADFSGEGPDQYYLNGAEISGKKYRSEIKKIQSSQGTLIGSLMVDDGFCGFEYTLEEALQKLASPDTQTPHPDSESDGLYGLAIKKLATRSGPGTQYKETGTYSVKNKYIRILARAWDSRNGSWWVKCEIPYKKEIRVLWTGYSRFDSDTLPLEDIPIETW